MTDNIKKAPFKNIIRYNLSNALLFGADKYIVLGYEHVIFPNQSISVNIGRAALPKLSSINTDSFDVQKDKKRSGFNVSVDYRFYLSKENKFQTPHGVYIGPYYSYNSFTSEIDWPFTGNSTGHSIESDSKFNIHTIGFEVGYQFIIWKRFAIDMVMIGPGLGIYTYKASFSSTLDAATKEQLLRGLKQLLTQKIPGMNYVFSDKNIDANGTMRANALGYRYLVHIGFNF